MVYIKYIKYKTVICMTRKITTVSIPTDLYDNARAKGFKFSKVLTDALHEKLNSVDYCETHEDKIELLTNMKTKLESNIQICKQSTSNTLNHSKEKYNLLVQKIKTEYEDEMSTMTRSLDSTNTKIAELVKMNTTKGIEVTAENNATEMVETILRSIIDHQIVSGNDPRIAPDVTDIKLLTADTGIKWQDIDKYWSVTKFKNKLNDIIMERIKLKVKEPAD